MIFIIPVVSAHQAPRSFPSELRSSLVADDAVAIAADGSFLGSLPTFTPLAKRWSFPNFCCWDASLGRTPLLPAQILQSTRHQGGLRMSPPRG